MLTYPENNGITPSSNNYTSSYKGEARRNTQRQMECMDGEAYRDLLLLVYTSITEQHPTRIIISLQLDQEESVVNYTEHQEPEHIGKDRATPPDRAQRVVFLILLISYLSSVHNSAVPSTERYKRRRNIYTWMVDIDGTRHL